MVNPLRIPQGLSPEQTRLYRSFVFLVRLTALALPLYIIIMLGVDMHLLQLAAATHSTLLLQAMGHQVLQQGTGITMEDPQKSQHNVKRPASIKAGKRRIADTKSTKKKEAQKDSA